MSDAVTKSRAQAFSQAMAIAHAGGSKRIADALERASKLPPGPALGPQEMAALFTDLTPDTTTLFIQHKPHCPRHPGGYPEGSACKTCESPDLTTLEREVVEKLREALQKLLTLTKVELGDTGNAEIQPWRRNIERCEAALAAANALQSARTPKGVKPSEVVPGTRFRFVPTPGEEGTGRCILYRADEQFFWSMDGSAELYRFRPDDKILPLNPQEPA